MKPLYTDADVDLACTWLRRFRFPRERPKAMDKSLLETMFNRLDEMEAAGVPFTHPESFAPWAEGTVHRLRLKHPPYEAGALITVGKIDWACAWVWPLENGGYDLLSRPIDINWLEPIKEPAPAPSFVSRFKAYFTNG